MSSSSLRKLSNFRQISQKETYDEGPRDRFDERIYCAKWCRLMAKSSGFAELRGMCFSRKPFLTLFVSLGCRRPFEEVIRT
jgi:hypothetical protein